MKYIHLFIIIMLVLGAATAAPLIRLDQLNKTQSWNSPLHGVTNGSGQDAATVSQTTAAIASANSSLKAYVDANDTLLDADIVNANTSMKAYVDLTAPTSDQKAALAGTSGTAPSASNKFVDNADTRMTNSRTPSSHASSHISTGGDAIAGSVAGGASGLMTGTDKTKLDGIAAGAEVNVQSDWNAGSGDALILNKPSTYAPSSHASSHISTGADAIAGAVAAGASGLMTGTDKTKLDGIASGAEVNVNADWNSASGDSQILNKPATYTPSSHNHAASEVTSGSLDGDRLAAPTTTKKGGVPAINNPTQSKYLKDDGSWGTPTGTLSGVLNKSAIGTYISGTSGYIPKFTGTNAIAGNSPIYTDDRHISSNTTTLDSSLRLRGYESSEHGKGAAIVLENSAPGGATWHIRTGATGTHTPSGGLSLGDNFAYHWYLTSNGNMGIGTIPATGNKLDVNGVINTESYLQMTGIGTQAAPAADAIKMYSKSGIPYYRNTSGEYVLSGGSVAAGVGDFYGVASSVTDDLISFADTGGKTAKDSGKKLSDLVYKDGSTTMTGNLAMGGYKVTGAANGTANGEFATYPQLETKSSKIHVIVGPASDDGSYQFETDGTNDEEQINLAIVYANAKMTSVELAPGTYNLGSSSILVDNIDNMCIYGGPNTIVNAGTVTPAIKINSSEHFRISGFHLHTATDATNVGICIDDTHVDLPSYIDHMHIHGFNTQISIGEGYWALGNLYITDNQIGQFSEIGRSYGIVIGNGIADYIVNNYITGYETAGIKVSHYADSLHISDNIIISVTDEFGGIASPNNIVLLSPSSGDRIVDLHISGNALENTQAYAIYADIDYASSGWYIHDNWFNGYASGVYIEGGNVLWNVQVKDNIFGAWREGTPTTSIGVAYSSNVQVVGNSINTENSLGLPITVWSPGTHGGIVSNNAINLGSTTDVSDRGICINADNTSVIGNSFFGTSATASRILLYSGTKYNTVIGNSGTGGRITNSGTGNIVLAGSNT